MYTDLNLYYLNALGIRPWIKKSNSELTKATVKLFIFHQGDLSKKAKNLLNSILFYLDIKTSELIIVHENQFSNIFPDSFKTAPPQSCLALGFNLDYFPEDLRQYCPIISTLSLDTVLNDPIQKRSILEDLRVIKNLLQTTKI